MVRVIDVDRQIHRTIVLLIFVIWLNGINDVFGSAAPNQNQVIENLKLLSQIDDSSNLQPPSRLRTLLVNDLRNILVKNVCAICVSRHMIYGELRCSFHIFVFSFYFIFFLC